MKPIIQESEVELIIRGAHPEVFSILGAHPAECEGKSVVAIRAFLPEAASVAVISDALAAPLPMVRLHPIGFFEAIAEDRPELFTYRLEVKDHAGRTSLIHDPYSFWPVLTEYDIYLLAQGNHIEAYEKLGAHPWDCGGVNGVLFAVWAPNASRVSVVGDFNNWDGRRHPMRIRVSCGVWELFIPGLGEGVHYKFEIRSRNGEHLFLKSDPFGFFSELRPNTASIVRRIDRHTWGDGEWIANRREKQGLDRPISIYEVHLGSWRRHVDDANSWLSYREMADRLIGYVREMGFTHIELMPVSEHPFDGSWGYQTTGYFAVNSRFGNPEDFQYLVDQCHQSGIGVILDWVPAHFPRDGHGLRFFDGTHLYEHEDPRMGEHRDWGTAIFNFGRTEVRNFLIANALFWFDKYHLDGLRVDAVASMLYLDYSRQPGEWIPNQYGGNENLDAVSFLKELNTIVHGKFPNVLTIAEESTSWPQVSHPVYLGGLGFSLKWNMGWMHDMLSYFSKDPVFRKFQHSKLTFALMYAFTENFVLVFSHDEVVHMKGSMIGKMPGDNWQKFANLRALYGLMYAFPGKKLIFMGGEFGQWGEWNHDSSLDWHLLDFEPHRKLQHCVRDLNHLYRDLPQLYSIDFHYSGFEWIDFADADQSIISFMRKAHDPDDFMVVVGNFTPVPRIGYRVGVSKLGTYSILFNSDCETYGGSNIGNDSKVAADEFSWQGRPYSLNLNLPPLGVVYLRHEKAR
jgi:1,4-alpha-glucan branching enzyme